MEDKTALAITGVLTLGAICISCIFRNIDGTIIAGVAGIIGTVIGYAFGVKKVS